MTSNSRARILGSIRESLQITVGHLSGQGAAYPPPHPRGPFIASELALVEQFSAELRALQGHVHICQGAHEALEAIRSIINAHNVAEVLAWDAEEFPLPGLLEQLRSSGVRAAELDRPGGDRRAQLSAVQGVMVSLTSAQAAIAESGSLLVVSGPGRSRLASLFTPVHIALLPADRIVRTLPEAIDHVQRQFGAELYANHSNVVLITGPSRTGDIELSLTLGVHGPSEIHAVVVC